MDMAMEELQTLTLTSILRESIGIPRSSPRTFSLLALTLIFPLSFAILAHTLFTHPILLRLESSSFSASSDEVHQWTLLFLYQFLYLLFLFTFSLLSTAAVVFTVASLYASKPVSFSSTLAAIPPVFSRLFHTFMWVSAIMTVYNLAFAITIVLLLQLFYKSAIFFVLLPFVVVGFVAVHVFISAVWHLASVVTVLEPVYGLAAMRKSRELLQGKTRLAAGLVLSYLAICAVISGIFRAVVVRGGEDGAGGGVEIGAKALVGGVLVAILVVVNLIGLLVQSVFYYVCKSYHHQSIDKSALYEHLGGYLGEYVPLKSSVQMENL